MSSFNNFTDNPYQSPNEPSSFGAPPPASKGKIMAPAVGLIVCGTLGLLFSIFNMVTAMAFPMAVDPNAPPFIQEMQRHSSGSVATTVQAAFVVVNLVIIFGGVQMARCASYGTAMTATILAMLNFGTCCCVIGIPIGIWSLVILLQPDVKGVFARGGT